LKSDVARDLSDSAYDFQRVVWPVICPNIGGGELIPVESVTASGFRHQLDTLAGIDAWHIHPTYGLRGISSRIQWCDKGWSTFTIRKDRDSGVVTEYEKRKQAIERSPEGWLYPIITVQAYIAKPARYGELISVAVAYTKDIINSVNEKQVRRTNNATFYYVNWSDLKSAGKRIRIIKP
jgi:hypothetical protein